MKKNLRFIGMKNKRPIFIWPTSGMKRSAWEIFFYEYFCEKISDR